MRTFSLRGHVALVTGGSRGIGAAIVKTLGEAGCSVAVNYRERAAEAEALARAIITAGGKAVAIAADVSKADAVTVMVGDGRSMTTSSWVESSPSATVSVTV